MDGAIAMFAAGLIAALAGIKVSLANGPVLGFAGGRKCEAFASGFFSLLFHRILERHRTAN